MDVDPPDGAGTVGGGADPVAAAAVLSRFTEGIDACLVSRLLLKAKGHQKSYAERQSALCMRRVLCSFLGQLGATKMVIL